MLQGTFRIKCRAYPAGVLILVLSDAQYSQKAVFGFEKGSNCQNHSSWGFLPPVKKSPPLPSPIKFPTPPHPTEGDLAPTPYRYLENPEMWCLAHCM